MNLNNSILTQVKRISISNDPYESCGFIINNGQKNIVYEGVNIADDKVNNFAISPYSYLKATYLGKIIGVFHSHTQSGHSDNFTELDKLNIQNHKIPMLLYNLNNDTFKISNDESISKYVGRKFEFNRYDCLSLVEDFYRNEFNIKLPEHDRNEHTLHDLPSLILDNISNYGFVPLSPDNAMKYGDIIISKYFNTPSHLMIYIDNNQVLHHRYNHYSIIEQFSNLHKSHTHSIVRHTSLWN